MPDLAAFSTALLAKPGWLLFRYTAHPWQCLVRHEVERAFQASVGRPAGYHRLVTDAASAPLLESATASASSLIAAFRQLRVARIVPPADQGFESVMLELTFHNAVPGHQPLEPDAVCVTAQQWLRLRDVRAACLHRQALPLPAQASLALILG